MPWVRIDDHFNEHPKLARVGPVGWGVWLAGIAYSNRNLTDGFIPRAVARSLCDFEMVDADGKVYELGITCGMTGADLDANWVIMFLLEAGIWEEVRGGYQIHDYTDYQPTKERILAERAQKTARQERWRESRRGRNASVDGDVDASKDGRVEPAPNPKPKEEPQEEEKATTTSKSQLRSDVLECFAYWQERCGHPTAKLTSDRRSKIEARLRDGYMVHEIRKGIDGAAVGAFVNDAGKRFDDIELICRTGSKLEDFMSRTRPQNVVPMRRESASDILDALRAAKGDAS